MDPLVVLPTVKEIIRRSLVQGNDHFSMTVALKEVRIALEQDGKEDVFAKYFCGSVMLAFQMVGKEIRDEITEKHIAIENSCFSSLLKLSIITCQEAICEPHMPLLILEEFFEATPISECEGIWNIFITFRKEFSSPLFIVHDRTTNSALALLSIVNSLLRRTSKMRDSSFRGSLMMFVSNVFHFEEKSGINVTNRFNEHPLPTFEPRDVIRKALEDPSVADTHINMEFYDKFWRLLSILSNRDYVIKNPSSWSEVRQLIDVVLNGMELVREVGGGDDKEKVVLDGTDLYVTMNDNEEIGRW